MTNAVVLGALLVSFAVFVTCHVAIAARLFVSARPRYRGLVALVVVPLAPMYAYQQRWRKLCWTWVGSVASYALAVAVASFVAT